MDENRFTVLEKSIFQWIADRYSDSALRSQIEKAVVLKREYTGTGWFVDLEVPEPRTLLDSKLGSPIDGPNIRSPQIEGDGRAMLFHENGVIKLLEIYGNGSHFERDVSQYKLYADEDWSHLA